MKKIEKALEHYKQGIEIWTQAFIDNIELPDYEVSNFGRLKSNKVGKKELKGSIIEGYNRVHLRVNGTRMKVLKHRLIMDSWCPIYESKAPEGFPEEDWQKLSFDAKIYIGSILLINHKDHNKTNNNITNLERVTPKQNSGKAITFYKGNFKNGKGNGRKNQIKKVTPTPHGNRKRPNIPQNI